MYQEFDYDLIFQDIYSFFSSDFSDVIKNRSSIILLCKNPHLSGKKKVIEIRLFYMTDPKTLLVLR